MTPTGQEISIGARLWRVAKAGWKWLRKPIDRFLDLERQVAALEARLAKKPGQDCPYCGEPALRMIWASPVIGRADGMSRDEKWRCEKCGKELDEVTRY